MEARDKVKILKQRIYEELSLIINYDYILLDLPYFSNIGDVLIWQGTLDILGTLPYKCLYSSSLENFSPQKIGNKVIILLMGGGNFGNIWIRHQYFRRKILEIYPNNKIIQLPQSIAYTEGKILEKDREIFAKHPDFTICVRDNISFQFATKHFKNNTILLLPDMAFCINPETYSRYSEKTKNHKILFLKRNDCEFKAASYNDVPKNADVRDWPSIEKMPFIIRLINKIRGITHNYPAINNGFSNFIYKRLLRKYYVKLGLKFISSYSMVYTTRLHVGILSTLLSKPIVFFDNSYGKNKEFYLTWLSDIDSIKFVEK